MRSAPQGSILSLMQDKTLQPYFLLAILGGSLLLVFYILQPFLAPLALATIFAVVLQPIYRELNLRFRGRESLASLTTVVIFAVIVLVPASLLATQLLREAQQLYITVSASGAHVAFGTLLDRGAEALSIVVPDAPERVESLSADIDLYAREALDWIIKHMGAAFSSLLTLFLNIFIFFVALYYLLRDGWLLTRRIVELSPLSDRDDSIILDKLGLAVNSVIKGQLAIALIQGTLTSIGLMLFGVPNAVLWGLVAALAALIPSLGTALVVAPAVAYLALVGSTGAAIGLALWGATAVGLVDNLLGPKLISAGLHLHPLLVMLAVIGGLVLFGPIGLFLGPISVSLLIVLLSIYRDVTKRTEENSVSVVQ